MKNHSIENTVQPIKNRFKFDSRKSTSCFHETTGCLYQQAELKNNVKTVY